MRYSAFQMSSLFETKKEIWSVRHPEGNLMFLFACRLNSWTVIREMCKSTCVFRSLSNRSVTLAFLKTALSWYPTNRPDWVMTLGRMCVCVLSGGHGWPAGGVLVEEAHRGAAQAEGPRAEAGLRGDHPPVWVVLPFRLTTTRYCDSTWYDDRIRRIVH